MPKKISSPKKTKKVSSTTGSKPREVKGQTRMSSGPPAGASAAGVVQGTLGHSNFSKTFSFPYTAAATGRPVRSNRGIGGQRDQLEKASAIVGEGLLNKVTGQKRDRNNVTSIPEDLTENDLAPPIPTKRQRVAKAVIIIIHLFFVLRNEYH